MTLRTLFAGTLFAFSGITASFAQAAVKHQIDIPRQSLGTALAEFARQARIQVVYSADLVKGHDSRALSGAMTPAEALSQLLTRTGLRFEFLDAQTVTLSDEEGSHLPRQQSSVTPEQSAEHGVVDGEEVSADPFAQFRLVQRETDQASSERDADTTNSPLSETKVNEVVVTAQKRTENLSDVPVPVTVISGDVLTEQNQLLLSQYYSKIPGLSMSPDNQNYKNLVIRGVGTGGGSGPTVGILVDEVPYGSALTLGTGGTVPDFDPNDLARIEVLRGPQGTLYGANAMGGLMKFVTVDPSTDRIHGRLQMGTSSVQNGSALGYNARGSMNLPLSDTWAIRAGGFTRQDPGYIDNPTIPADGVNETRVHGGRLAALWRPSDVFSLKLSSLYQKAKSDGADVAFESLGDLQSNYLLHGGAYDKATQAYSAVMAARLGIVDLTSVTGYNINKMQDSRDVTANWASSTQAQFGVTGSMAYDDFESKKFTQEVRLQIPQGERLEWLLGAFYSRERNSFNQALFAQTVSGQKVGQWHSNTLPTTLDELAAFANLTIRFSDRFDVQFGGRESRIEQTYSQALVGPYAEVFYGVPALITPRIDTESNTFTYLVTPRLKISPDLMMYVRLASGYRPGGPNPAGGSVVVEGRPPQYFPDKTNNYEIGVKGNSPSGALSFDASVYYIDWKNIQLNLFFNGQSFVDNAGAAKSQGVELQVEARPLPGLTLSGWVAWNDAELTKNFPSTSLAYGVAGDRLPISARFSGNVSLNQDFPIGENVEGFFAGSISYVGNRLGGFGYAPPSIDPRRVFSPYTQIDMRAGVRYESWAASLFANNVADKRSILSGPFIPGDAFFYLVPRTIGVNLSKSFE